MPACACVDHPACGATLRRRDLRSRQPSPSGTLVPRLHPCSSPVPSFCAVSLHLQHRLDGPQGRYRWLLKAGTCGNLRRRGIVLLPRLAPIAHHA